jgi:hypothetical protein
VTNPKRADLAPGGPVNRLAWKAIRPGIYRGYWESYKAEIATYELDKLLELHMVPVTVERRVNKELGAAIMWVSPTRSFSDLGGPPKPPPAHSDRWNIQIIRAKMLDNLIYNKDPNLGNWLVDPAWNLVLIDHTRAFTTDKKMAHELTRVDRDLWERMKRLDEPTLTAALRAWLTQPEIRAMLERRDLMEAIIGKLVAARGEADVLVRYTEPRSAAAAAPLTEAQDLAQRAFRAVQKPLLVPPSSEVVWIGQVVSLATYQGPYEDVAKAGVQSGHTLGLLTNGSGLLCLAPDGSNPGPHDVLRGFTGQQAEIFGMATVSGGMTVVQVTRARNMR